MQRAVELNSNGLTLRGTLHVPDKMNKKNPIVCIFHGFTGNKMEPHFIFVKLSRMLEKNGIASIRFDFGGSGESDGDFVNMTLSKELEDAKNILNYVKNLDFVDTNKIAVVGFSMGGAVAGMLAGERRNDVKALCLWAPAGVMREIIIQGKSEEDIQNMRKIGYCDIGGLLLGINFLDDIQSLDIYQKSATYDKNVIILHGGKDSTVPISASEKYLEIYETKGALHVVQGADHTFNNKAWEDEVLDYTIGFLKEELKA